ncbi:UDP-N-acetyl-D-mannosamine dehydrogenase [uncultured Microbulbifer sp.]|uniref:UDP-N-acetyl-D-mannosamine dehydrogenase n=1 Tax=uncultured Microbulbifer sp. TaxID=348147 RepID=UPI0025CBE87C|nr:UDP-N-acetyl-D-mannosamine dehydrogenase [uncultured Microbulbifer sp.]
MLLRRSPFNRVSVIGLGYIGLPTAAILAASGAEVVGVDISERAVNAVNAGRIHIVEPGLEPLVKSEVDSGRLRAVLSPEPADAFIITVPTPLTESEPGLIPEPDASYIQAAADAIAPVLKAGNLIILESTSPVGTTEQLARWLKSARPDLSFPGCGDDARPDIHIAYCPERVLPGHVLKELVRNDRIIGGCTPECSAAAGALYQRFVSGACIVTDARTAELTKLTENAFRDVNIAFANEMALVCDQLGIDVWELIRLANRHPRVNILNPGPGVGGHCIAVDPWFIAHGAPDQARLITQARRVNDARPGYVVEQALHAAGSRENPVIACLGLAFKPDIDDLRESPALQVATRLAQQSKCRVLAVEPNIGALPAPLAAADVELVPLDAALKEANVVVVLVDHREFLQIDPDALSGKSIIDTRGLLPRLRAPLVTAQHVDDKQPVEDSV